VFEHRPTDGRLDERDRTARVAARSPSSSAARSPITSFCPYPNRERRLALRARLWSWGRHDWMGGRRLQISARRHPASRGVRRRTQRRYSRGVRTTQTCLTAGPVLGVAALHVAWGAGKSFPFHDRERLADAVVGTAAVPPAPACYAVAGALTAAAALMQGFPAGHPTLRRVGLLGVAVVLGGRGVLGLTGRTDLVSPTSTSARFRRLDRNLYSPLCLALARCAWSAASAPSRD